MKSFHNKILHFGVILRTFFLLVFLTICFKNSCNFTITKRQEDRFENESLFPNFIKYLFMKTLTKIVLMLCLSIFVFSSCTKNKEIQSAEELTKRILPSNFDKFKFVQKQSDSNKDYFSLEQCGDKICVTANNSNSMAVGLNYYLKHYAKVYVSWFAHDLIEVPKVFPNIPEKITKEAIVENRFFLNYCTYGYTMPWWGWNEWEHFIDWMALNGVTMPLSITGQESVWYEVWKEYGMTDSEIRSYFSAPAHLPWHRMANLDGFGGELPMSWLDTQKELQKQIVARERALNMTPILPAFAGHVPQKIAEKFPNADIQQLSEWCGFEPTYFLNSQDSLFANIQKSFITKQIDLYGTDHIYGFDPFNEMDPPSWDADYLSAVSENIYKSLQSVDQDAEWLQMTWVFYYKRKHWTSERLEAYLTAVPQDKLILLDYFCENTEVWRSSKGFFGQPFIWCYLGNFGGNTMLIGDINELENKLSKALSEADKNLVGIGSTLESFDVSPQIFDYLFERVWEPEGQVKNWTKNWASLRYGSENENAVQAWEILVDSVYKDWSYYGLGTQLDARPSLEGHGTYYTKPYYSYSNKNLLKAFSLLLETPSERKTYEYDLVNFGSQLLGNYFVDIRNNFTQAYKEKNIEKMTQYVEEANELFVDVENLLATNEAFLLGKWIADARALGTTDEEKAYYEQNARMILTIWGGPILNDYANRMWAGLMSDYYSQRWNLFFDAVIKAVKERETFDSKAFGEDLSVWENAWNKQATKFPSQPVGNTLEQAQIIKQKWGDKIAN